MRIFRNLSMSAAKLSLGAAIYVSALPALAQPAAEFYAGKRLTIIVGTAAGGGYDTYARMIARYMPSHLPGNVNIVVQNMPGAGSNVSAAYIQNVAPKDGTWIGAYQSGLVLEPLIGSRPINHDPSKAHYLGSANDDIYICIARSDAPVKDFADAFTNEMVMGASGASSSSDYAWILNAVLGTKFKVVLGYQGSRQISLAIEKGEAQGACGFAWPSISVTQPREFETGALKVIVQAHSTGHPDLNAKGVPLAGSFAKSPEDKAVLDFFFSQTRFGRPYALAAGVPDDRVAFMRKVFSQTMQNTQLRAEAAKMKLDVDYVSGEDLQALVARIYAAPPNVIERTKAALNPK